MFSRIVGYTVRHKLQHMSKKIQYQLLIRRAAFFVIALIVAFTSHLSPAYAALSFNFPPTENVIALFDRQHFAEEAKKIEDSNEEKSDEKEEFVKEPFQASRVVEESSFYVQPVPPRKKQVQVVRTEHVPMTAYSSTPDQTDSTPYTTASGTRTRHGVVAANFLPIGTKLRIPDHFGDQVFVVEDRMNSRYWKKVDVWMPTRAQALRFGARHEEIEIIREI